MWHQALERRHLRSLPLRQSNPIHAPLPSCDTGGMKKPAPKTRAAKPPAEAAPATQQGEGGGGKTPQSTIKLLRPDQVWQPKIGAPYGNQNALKPYNAVRRKVRELQRRCRAILKSIA
jgi:hypothetical protein